MPKTQSDMKQRIIEESIKLFGNKGFDGTSMRDIARAVGTSLPSIYYHFNSKEGLYHAVVSHVSGQFNLAMLNAKTGGKSIEEQLVAMGVAKYQFIANNPDLIQLYLRELYGPRSVGHLEEGLSAGIERIGGVIKEGVKRGEFRPVDPGIAAWFLMAIFSVYDVRIANRGELPSEDEIKVLVDLAFRGIKKSE